MKEEIYMLRRWREKDSSWRLSLKNIETGETRFLLSTKELVSYLNGEDQPKEKETR